MSQASCRLSGRRRRQGGTLIGNYHVGPQPLLPMGAGARSNALRPNEGAAAKALRPLSAGGGGCLYLCALLIPGFVFDVGVSGAPTTEAFAMSTMVAMVSPLPLVAALDLRTVGSSDIAALRPIGRDTIRWAMARLDRATPDLPRSHRMSRKDCSGSWQGPDAPAVRRTRSSPRWAVAMS
jgi:hypothetical protein